MHKRIVTARAALTKARERLEAVTKEVQQKCKHERVLEAPSHIGIVVDFLPRRLCIDCGLEEEAWHWGPSARDRNGKKLKLNSQFIKHVTRDELHKARYE